MQRTTSRTNIGRTSRDEHGLRERNAFYHNCIHNLDYSSHGVNPLLKFLVNLYADPDRPEEYENSWVEWVGSMQAAAHVSPKPIQRASYQDTVFVLDRSELEVITHGPDNGLFVHDKRVSVGSGDWKRIRQVYKRLKDR